MSYISLTDRLTKFAWDDGTPDGTTGYRLDDILVHELSHLLGDMHIEPQTTPIAETAMQQMCS